VQVTVGGRSCFNVQPAPGKPIDKALTCTLPQGVGLNRLVVVRSGKLYSLGKPIVSYSLPKLDKVVGCIQNGLDTKDCNRVGGQKITVYGEFFGKQRAKVVIGGEVCKNVVHNATIPNRQLTCIIPSGVQIDRTVVLIQNEGELAKKGRSLSYFQCQPGRYSKNDGRDIVCSNCTRGTYTAVISQKACLEW
jgi:hypothetical protein